MKAITDLRVRMTIRLEGLTSSQVDALHKVSEDTYTKTLNIGGRVNLPGDKGERFIEVTKSELKGAGGKYTVLLTVYLFLEGWVYPPLPGKDRRWAEVHPSRRGLDGIFEALDILPEKETVESRTVPASHGGPYEV